MAMRRILPCLFLLPTSFVCFRAGRWQQGRKKQKLEWIDLRTDKMTKEPIDANENILQAFEDYDEYTRITFQGHYNHDKQIAIKRTKTGVPGYHILTPFQTINNQWILVDRGWLPYTFFGEESTKPKDLQQCEAILRKGEVPNKYVPKNQPPDWYYINIEDIKTYSGLNIPVNYMAQLIDVKQDVNMLRMQQKYPMPKTLDELLTWPTMPAHHDGYIIFWYGSSIIGTIFSLLFLFKRI